MSSDVGSLSSDNTRQIVRERRKGFFGGEGGRNIFFPSLAAGLKKEDRHKICG